MAERGSGSSASPGFLISFKMSSNLSSSMLGCEVRPDFLLFEGIIIGLSFFTGLFFESCETLSDCLGLAGPEGNCGGAMEPSQVPGVGLREEDGAF